MRTVFPNYQKSFLLPPLQGGGGSKVKYFEKYTPLIRGDGKP